MKKAFPSMHQIEYDSSIGILFVSEKYFPFSLSFFRKNGETSLHVAARYGHPHIVEHLCKLGANVDCQDDVS